MHDEYTVSTIVSMVLIAQMPVTFALVIYGHPRATLLVVYAHEEEGIAQKIGLYLTMPCLFVSALLAYAGVVAKQQKNDECNNSTGFDGDDDVNPSKDLVFWGSAFCFAVLRNCLLIEDVDVFAVVLLSLSWFLSVFTSCRRVAQSTWLWIRLMSILGFVCTSLLLCVLVCVAMDTQTEAYVLGMCAVGDILLITGHTWDYPESSTSTVMNCRFAYVCMLQLALPLGVAANTGVL